MRRISLGIAALIVVSALQLGQPSEAKSLGAIVDSALNAVSGYGGYSPYGGYYGGYTNPYYGSGYVNPYLGSYVNPYVNPYVNTYTNPYGYGYGYDPYRRSTLGTIINTVNQLDRWF
jgi:hypothetical protein